jgi:hypothetical protein
MATLIKKGRKSPTAASAPEAAPEETTSMEMVSMAESPAVHEAAPNDVGMIYSAPTAPLPNMPRSYGQMSGYDQGATYAPPGGADDFQPRKRHIAAEPPPSAPPPAGPAGLLKRVLLFSGETKPEERDRVAAQEFEQAIAPVMEYMRSHVEASSPEEAARIWAENQGEITPDPKGGSYVPGDSFDTDARVYYRLLHRNYEKTPRPSEKRKESRALSRAGGSDGYRLLPGTRGW